MGTMQAVSSGVWLLLEAAVLTVQITWTYLEAAYRWVVPRGRKPVAGRAVLITGAAGGLGRQLALHFARLGARLVLWDIDQEGNEKTAALVREEGAEAYPHVCDVRLREDVRRAARAAREDLQDDVHVLVNNAGVMTGRELLELSEQEVTNTMTTNTVAHFWTVQEFLPGMIQNKFGHIVTISSMSGVHGVAMVTDYSASKFAVIGFTEALQDEIDRSGYSDVIKTTVACPYMVNTNLLASLHYRLRPHARFDKVMEPEDVAEQIVDGVLRDKHIIYVPGKTAFMRFMKTLMPQKAVGHIMKFADTGFFKVSEKERIHGSY